MSRHNIPVETTHRAIQMVLLASGCQPHLSETKEMPYVRAACRDRNAFFQRLHRVV
jgi:hypothetical protein